MKQLVWAAASVIPFRHLPYRNSYRSVAAQPWEFPADRFNLANNMLELDAVNIVEDPEFDLNNINCNWRDRYFALLDDVADDVYRQVGDRTIYLAYSGGVDSIAVLTALQRHPKYNEFLKSNRFRIFLNSVSIEELPSLFYQHILPNLPLSVANFNQIMLDPDAYLVTGDLGDFVIGSSDVIRFDKLYKDFDLMSPWTEIYTLLKLVNNSGKYLEIVELLKKAEPFEISSVGQLSWWLGQCLTVQYELTKPYVWSETTDLSGLDNESKVFRFFHNRKITTFSYEYMSTNPRINSYSDMKVLPKEYAFNHFNDHGILTKTKVSSHTYVHKFVHKTKIFKTENGYESIMDTERL